MSEPKKSGDPVWDEIFGSREYAKYPHEEVIRFVARHFYRAPDRSKVKLLDLGCGPGADLWYIAREGFDTAALDGSAVGVERSKARLAAEGLRADVRQGMFDEIPWADATFDGVIDVRAIQCNPFGLAQRIVKEVHRVLKPGGWFYSSMLTDRTYGYGLGKRVEPGGFTDVPNGPCAGIGFSLMLGRSQVDELYGGFADVRVELSSLTFDGMRCLIEAWNVEAQKAK